VPLVVQVNPAPVLVALAPVMVTGPEVEHEVWFPPALAVGAPVMNNVFDEVAFPQGAFPTAVKVKVTLPAAISAAFGV